MIQNNFMGIRQIFIQNLKYYRKQAGLTQEKLAEIIEMSTSYIGDMEARERFPSAETIDKIAEALNIPVSTLFNERGSPQATQNTFVKIYGNSLKEELSKRILKDIEEVCKLI
ncbi:MAG: helix-turn-helix transcriptional regulator [Spirochaetaceae bacterium]|nr:helix-turn-helix transcriptional regulator [Spirochaetaceae bacterium]